MEYIPKLSDDLYNYIQAYGFYDDVSGASLFHNLKQVYNKMLSFKALGYPSLRKTIHQSVPMVQITNTNENKVDISISFSDVRKEIENMSALLSNIEKYVGIINQQQIQIVFFRITCINWRNKESIQSLVLCMVKRGKW